MDFFSKLGKKASKTYQITKEKATTLSEELKLKGKISESKDKIEDLYKKIGEKVFEEMTAGKDVVKEEILDKIEEIAILKDNIEKLNIEILALKKLKKCDNCGLELELDAEFCSKCGKHQEKPEKVEIHEEPKNDAQEAEVVEVKDVENVQESQEQNVEENIEENKEEQ